MATVLTLGSLKGGVGKTVASTNVAACLAMRGYKTLFIDLDPQATATAHFGIDSAPDEDKRIPTVGEVLYTPENYAQVKLPAAIVKHDRIENLWVIPSNYGALAAAEDNLDGFARVTAVQMKIINHLPQILPDLDFVIIDTRPTLGCSPITLWWQQITQSRFAPLMAQPSQVPSPWWIVSKICMNTHPA